MTNPHTGEGFDAPPPAEAYAQAPPIVEELSAVHGLQTATCHPDTSREHRINLLRKAAVFDRLAVRDQDSDTVTEAAHLAHELGRLDRATGYSAGPIGPGSMEWDPSHRPYVRQEFVAWMASRRHNNTR